MGKWVARVEYADGTSLVKEFPYRANGDYSKECEEQYDIECRIIEDSENEITWYSVDYVDE